MNEKIVPNMNFTLDEFFERAARAIIYKVAEANRDESWNFNNLETWQEERLASVAEERIRDVFYELFEIQRTEDASAATDDAIKMGLFGIQKALEQVERRLCERRSVVHPRDGSVLDDVLTTGREP